MTRAASLLLAGFAAFAAATAQAQNPPPSPASIAPQPAEGLKAPPPPGPQPGPVTGSAADSPAVSGQADGQPVVTPPQSAGASVVPSVPNAPKAGPGPDVIQASAGPNHATMPESPTLKTPEPSRF